METTETVKAKGQVTPSFINMATGATLPWNTRHNTLTYDASKAIAGALGGDQTVVPNRIGIIYGPKDQTFSTTIDRDQSWSVLDGELTKIKCNVQVRPFSYSPTVTKIDDTSYGVTFHMHSDSTTPGVFGDDATDIFTTGKTVYQAVLLNYSDGEYTIIARVDLKPASGNYRTKPTDFEVALDWTVKFL